MKIPAVKKTEEPILKMTASYYWSHLKAMQEFEKKAKPHLEKIGRWTDNFLMILEEAFYSKLWERTYEDETTEKNI